MKLRTDIDAQGFGCGEQMRKHTLLVGDIGGTNARFALADPGGSGFSNDKSLRCADFASAELAIRHYLDEVGAVKPTVICLAVAGPIVEQRVRFTNNNWSIGIEDLRDAFGTRLVGLCNDFEAIAYSIPSLQSSDCLPVGLPEPGVLPDSDFTVGVIGPGTGLGAAGLCRRDGKIFAIVGEGGHVGFAPESKVQIDVFAALRERFDRVSDERLVSGPGLENIYWALSQIHGDKSARLTAAEICKSGANNNAGRAGEALQLFFEILGQVAGNLALSLGATSGVYVAGGIARRYPELLTASRFRTGFEAKGRHRSLMERIPTQLILYPEPGLLGAGYCARQIARQVARRGK
jgi:glucokinase